MQDDDLSSLDTLENVLRTKGSMSLAEAGGICKRRGTSKKLSYVLAHDQRFWLSEDKQIVHLNTTVISINSFQYVATCSKALTIVEKIQCERDIAVDLEGDLSESGKMSLIQVESQGQVYIFDVYVCPKIVSECLKSILESSDILKVMHDCRNDSVALRGQFGVLLQNVFDTQCAHAVIEGKRVNGFRRGLNDILSKYAGKCNLFKNQVQHRPGLWEQRPLPPTLLNYAAQDVQHMRQAYVSMRDTLSKMGILSVALQESDRNNSGRKGPLRRKAQGQEKQARVSDTANEFFKHLESDESMRSLCTDRCYFNDALNRWKQEHPAFVGGPSAVLYHLVKGKKVRIIPGNNVLVFKGNRPGSSVKAEVDRVLKNRKVMESDKHGIVIDQISLDKRHDGSLNVVPPGIPQYHHITINNTVDRPQVLSSVSIIGNRNACFEIQASTPQELLPKSSCRLTLKAQPIMIGVFKSILSFSFQGFSISRFLTLNCGDSDLTDILKPISPYQGARRKKRAQRDNSAPVEEGERPENGGGNHNTALPRMPRQTPNSFKDDVKRGNVECSLELYTANLNLGNYKDFFETLLKLELMQMEVDIRNFDMQGVCLTPSKVQGCVELFVPGLLEKRPSVLRGDSVVATVPGGQRFRGYAHAIFLNSVSLKFSKSFHAKYSLIKADIEFEFSKSTFAAMFQGLSQSKCLSERVLFPSLDNIFENAGRFCDVLNLFNRNLNSRQQLAVKCILEGKASCLPYLLFGPPGTGKTVTLVEVVLQFLRKFEDFKILICSPSNTAADIFVQRLKNHIKPAEMLRLNAWSRNPKDVPDEVRPYTTCPSEAGFSSGFELPAFKILFAKRVVVATCSTAAKLYNMDIPRGHFNVIVVDEAGHAWEPEVSASLSCLMDCSQGSATQLVLAGDPRQLGPIVRSDLAKRYGLGTSMLERLIERDLYRRKPDMFPEYSGYDCRFVTKLVENYRSHPSILKLPNAMFYDGELLSRADPMTVSHVLEDWEHLLQKKFPLIFHGVEGQDDREANSPSWFNISEIQLVMNYVDLLTQQTRRNRVLPSQIGIITPYAKQVEKLRKALKLIDMGGTGGPMVGSVEVFQGQERRVIIISTVRSSPKYVEIDAEYNLGFVSNPKRFNVAITRACALLIVIGNPKVLAADPHWGSLLWYCVEHGAYTGSDLPPRPSPEGTDDLEDSDGLLAQLQALQVDDGGPVDDAPGSGDEGSGPAYRELVEGPAWRSDD